MEENNNLTNVDFSNQELDSSSNLGETPICGSMDSLFDELMRDDDTYTHTHACTHFHTCNPPGPDSFPHTHTCVHVHTKPVPPDNDGAHSNEDFSESNGRKRGWEAGSNREAVRKYRQKKKAYTASLANELVSLRATNQHLVQKLQHQVTLQSEVARLKCLLVDIRGRIEGEIGSFPYQATVKTTGDMQHQNISNANILSSCTIPCNVQCGDQNINCVGALESPSSFN